jgi:hypothetical protein
VTLVTLATLWQHLPKAHRHGGLPFVLTFGGILYGFLVGLVQGSPIAVTKELLDWLIPVLFGFHLFVNWRDYPRYRQNIQRTFVWGVLVAGVYGVFQYLVAPEWDRFWLINVMQEAGADSFGKPEPLGIRVWSTMNGPTDFAVVMMAGLLLLFSDEGVLRLPASGVGYLTFLLTLTRTAWGGWFVGLLALVSSLKSILKMRLIITILVIAIFAIPLTTIEPFAGVIHSRLETISNPDDGAGSSASERKQTYGKLLGPALTNFLGYGIGNIPNFGRPLDSSILVMFFSLGWIGVIFYLGGWFLLVFESFQSAESFIDVFASTARAIALSSLFMFILAQVVLGVTGVVIWGFLGMSVAANKYYWNQRIIRVRQSSGLN